MNTYEQRQAARRERLESAARQAAACSAAAYDASNRATAGIVPGQPVLTDHHSASRHRRALEKSHEAMRRCVAEEKRAGDLAARAAGVGGGGISSDDPDAVTKLKEKLARLEAEHARLKATPPAARSSWELAYSARAVSATRKRIEELKNRTALPCTTAVYDGFAVVQDVEANRVQILFSGVPDAGTRTRLKELGFRWAPSGGAWQRHLNGAGIYAAEQFVMQMEQSGV